MKTGIRLYLGTPGWGWRMYGIGYGTKWFLGLSINACAAQENPVVPARGEGVVLKVVKSSSFNET